jgi:hypothetical protein
MAATRKVEPERKLDKKANPREVSAEMIIRPKAKVGHLLASQQLAR